MSTAVCKECDLIIHWRAGRGSKLAEYKCKCGGPLEAWSNTKHDGQLHVNTWGNNGVPWISTIGRPGEKCVRKPVRSG